jgi:3-oxoacyl-(acyl-carrier-protein) synthase
VTAGTLAMAHWPVDEHDTLPAIAGFVVSAFSPLVAEVAERCLGGHYGRPPAPAELGARTGVVLASGRGDVTTTDTVTEALAAGARVAPLLFFQSNPNAVLGYLTARWGLAGPVVCVSPVGDPVSDALAVADALIDDGDADAVLVISADLDDGADPDRAVALLVGPPR